MALETWLLFLIAAIGISLAPGPNGLLALTHGAIHGRRKALFTITGGLSGFILIIALSMFGIGALIKSSLWWFALLKWVGGAYLVWLGIKLWLAPPITLDGGGGATGAKGRTLFRQGFLSAATNPKALLFFSALLPQFIDPGQSLVMQFLVVALTYSFTEFVVEYAFATAAQRIRPWLSLCGKRFQQICGGLFVAIGLALPLRT